MYTNKPLTSQHLTVPYKHNVYLPMKILLTEGGQDDDSISFHLNQNSIISIIVQLSRQQAYQMILSI